MLNVNSTSDISVQFLTYIFGNNADVTIVMINRKAITSVLCVAAVSKGKLLSNFQSAVINVSEMLKPNVLN